MMVEAEEREEWEIDPELTCGVSAFWAVRVEEESMGGREETLKYCCTSLIWREGWWLGGMNACTLSGFRTPSNFYGNCCVVLLGINRKCTCRKQKARIIHSSYLSKHNK